MSVRTWLQKVYDQSRYERNRNCCLKCDLKMLSDGVNEFDEPERQNNNVIWSHHVDCLMPYWAYIDRVQLSKLNVYHHMLYHAYPLPPTYDPRDAINITEKPHSIYDHNKCKVFKKYKDYEVRDDKGEYNKLYPQGI